MALATVLVALLLSAQPGSAGGTPCRFRDVVRSPDTPAIPQPGTGEWPRLEHVLFPAHPIVVTAWLWLGADGRVTDGCVVGAPDGASDRILAAARTLRYAPARHRGRAVPTIVGKRYEFAGRTKRYGLQDRIAVAGDVAWLERIASSEREAALFWHSARPIGLPADLRIAAYARLGEIGTVESVGAQKRVAAAAAARPLIPDGAPLNAPWPHAARHLGQYTPRPLAETRSTGGSRLVVLAADMLGPWQLFILRCPADSTARCSRPKPVGAWALHDIKVDASMTELAPGRLQLRIVPREGRIPTGPGGAASRTDPADPPPPETRTILLADVDRDADADGWTDLEERLLGLDPSRADSDGDGIDDAHDRAPLVARAAKPGSDDQAIVRAAMFAVFGLTESRWALFARPDRVAPIDVPGLPAMLLFHRTFPSNPLAAGVPGGIFVQWKIIRKSASDAVVDIADWVALGAAGGQDVFLRRIRGEWVVIARQPTWMS